MVGHFFKTVYWEKKKIYYKHRDQPMFTLIFNHFFPMKNLVIRLANCPPGERTDSTQTLDV